MRLHQIVKQARTLRNITQAELCEQAQVNQASLSRFERDSAGLSVDALERVLNVLGITMTIEGSGAKVEHVLECANPCN